MSYILDALRKAERDRGLPRVPTLATVHQPAAAPARRRLWPWIAGVVVFANAVVLAWLMSGTRAPELSVRQAPAPSRAAPAPVTSPAPPAPASPADADSVAAAGPPADERRRPPAEVRPEGTTPPPAGSARPETDIRPPAAPAAAATAPAWPSVAPTAETPPPKRAAAAVRQSPERVSPSRPPAPVADKAAAAPSAAASEILEKMNLQAVVYSDNPRERIVFINNQKFVEGQSIDGTVTVERIMPDGVVLTAQGERVTLRAEGAGRP
ncbi:MAG TPA: general secretion pathway protein GspB [Methylomirabilota bacterium]